MAKKALISIAFCGSTRSDLSRSYEKLFQSKGIEGHWLRSYEGWWMIEQQWFQLECEMEENVGYILPTCLTNNERDRMFFDLLAGRLVMMVHYVEEAPPPPSISLRVT